MNQATMTVRPDKQSDFKFGEHSFRWNDEIVELHDSSPDFQNTALLHERMREDGYLFIRGFHPRDKANRAANSVLTTIGERGGLEPGTDISDGIIGPENRNYSFFREIKVAHAPEVLDAIDGAHSRDFYARFLGGPSLTFDKRWLRAMGRGGHNHFHYDNVYVGRGTRNRYTMWTALTDIPLDNGPLVLALGSHRARRLIETYGNTDTDRDLSDPVLSTNPREIVSHFGFKLATAHFHPGDCLIFGMFMLHSSAPNLRNRYRISVDTRHQLASDEKDERFFGADGKWLGNGYNVGAKLRPMSELRAEWKI